MSKKSDDMIFNAILMALIGLAAVAIVLMSRMGNAIYRWAQSYRNKNKTAASPHIRHTTPASLWTSQRPSQSTQEFQPISVPVYEWSEQIKDAWSRGDYDLARAQLQRIAYTMIEPSVTADEKMRFTQLMTEFAKEDPLYNDVIQRAMPMITVNPGVVQSQIYKGQPEHIKEQMRYVFYFAHELGHIRREKNGSSYKLYPPEVKEMYGNKFIEVKREDGIVTYETLPKSAGGTGTQMTATIDEESAELLREATRLKGEKDWNGAIEALKKADARTGTVGVRLPLYLQQAGRFEEAMIGFNKLLSEVESQAAKDFSHHPERFWKGFSYYPRSHIYDKMRLACKRQKLPEEAAKYEVLRDEFLEKHEKFRREFDNWHRKDLEQRIANRGF